MKTQTQASPVIITGFRPSRAGIITVLALIVVLFGVSFLLFL
jgi:hypothetical protein